MARLTKDKRQEIIREFASRHNGTYMPALFVEEVRGTPDHPAYGWFDWDPGKAAHEHWLWQAREFASGLMVKFSIETIGRNEAIRVREVEMPFALSPMEYRRSGGGYYLLDPDNPGHMAELCGQAATALSSWVNRYRGAVEHAGGSVAAIERQLKLLEAAAPVDEDAEAA